MTTRVITDVAAADRQWAAIRAALPTPVVLAENLHFEVRRPVVHILTLRDVVRSHRVLTGLDEPWSLIPAEACFCASSKALAILKFTTWKALREQHTFRLPTCKACLRFCTILTKLPVDQIRGERP